MSRRLRALLLVLLSALGAAPLAAQTLRLLQPSPLRAERSPAAPALLALAAGQRVTLLELQAGWARVQMGAAVGWLRTSTLEMPGAEVAAASQTAGGRRAAGAIAVMLGTRTLPPRSNRHALIIGLGRYQADPARPVPPLGGVQHDMVSAMAMARLLQVPPDQVTLLRDAAATHDGVKQALQDLSARVQPGDRVFVYWSGHGSRYYDAAEGGCVETLVPYDLQDIGHREFAQWIQPLAAKADKMLVVYDACHSGGVGATGRGFGGRFTPRFAGTAAACQQPSNLPSRGWSAATRAAGVSAHDVVHLASSRPDEVSFDDADSGGLATSALHRCLQGEARDIDGSGAISVDELVQCAQERIESRLRGQAQVLPPHMVVSGNGGFVPAWFGAAPAGAPVAPVAAPALPMAQVLAQIHAQRDDKRRVDVRLASERLRIDHDTLDLAVTSSHAGHVYAAMLGSDGRSLTLLFPNALDGRNEIAAGQTLLLPRPAWRVGAGGPPGTDQLLVMVTDRPRDLATLAGTNAGPFVQPLTDGDGRARLQWLLASDAFGSALLTVQEY